MKKYFLFIVVNLFFNAAIAQTQHYYFKAEYGIGRSTSKVRDALNNVPSAELIFDKNYKTKFKGFAVGSKVDNMSVELEYINTSFNKKNNDSTIVPANNSLKSEGNSLFLNGYYHTKQFYFLSPYFMIGAGGAKEEEEFKDTLNNRKVKLSKGKILYQFGTGLEYMLFDGYSVGIGYRLMGKSPVKTELKTKVAADEYTYTLKQKVTHLGMLDIKFYF